jgi:F-type H+-transporting ATPase subunit alpha
MTEAEQAVRDAATEIPADLRARLASAEELSAAEREAVIKAAGHALAPFLPASGPVEPA